MPSPESIASAEFSLTKVCTPLLSTRCTPISTVTQICVEDTVHDGFANEIKVIVASDGCSSFQENLHTAALENFAMKYAVVDTAEHIIERYR